jgi:hypothetical protein
VSYNNYLYKCPTKAQLNSSAFTEVSPPPDQYPLENNIFGDFDHCETSRDWRKYLGMTQEKYQTLNYQFNECHNAFMKPREVPPKIGVQENLPKRADFAQ